MPTEAVAACLALAPGDVTAGHHGPLVASMGVRFVLAEIASREALRRARLDPAAWAEHMPEDPATGSAAVTLAAVLADSGPDGETALRIE